MLNGLQTEIWAKKLIDALIGQGIEYFCAAPGSRSTPLSFAIANHLKARWTVHFDERGLCFHALGYAKSAKKPAVVMATSGTAIGNLMPAIMEASNDRVPLIILSADRPPELRDCGANQTVDQVKLFNNFVRWQIDLPCPDRQLSDRYLASVISQAVLMASFPPAGPVHLNCMFREPLLHTQPEQGFLSQQIHIAPPELKPSEIAIAEWQQKLTTKRRGVILVGSSPSDLSDAVISLAHRLQWPIFADIFSSLRNKAPYSEVISHFDPILKIKARTPVDAVIQFGDRFVSKVLAQWLEKQNLDFYLQVAEQPLRNDPMHRVTHRVISAPQEFAQELKKRLPQVKETSWLEQWCDWDKRCQETLSDLFLDDAKLTEPAVIRHIARFLSKDWNLFLANSMPVRDANQFFFSSSGCGTIFGNRGVSGIDGNIATICGLAEGNAKATLGVIGDLAFLHDINSLALMAKAKQPIVLCVINNGGGGIFSFLPVAKRKEAFEEFIAASHEIQFESAAKLFNIPYFHPQTPAELTDLLFQQQTTPQTCIVEMTTDRVQNVHVHEQILKAIGTCLSSADSPLEIPATLH